MKCPGCPLETGCEVKCGLFIDKKRARTRIRASNQIGAEDRAARTNQILTLRHAGHAGSVIASMVGVSDATVWHALRQHSHTLGQFSIDGSVCSATELAQSRCQRAGS